MAVGGQHKIQGRALRNRCKLCVAILLWPWSSFASAPSGFWIFALGSGSMGQFPSSMLGGCECAEGDLAILDSAGRLTLLWILLAPPDLQNLTKWKAFLEVSHLRFLALFRIQLRDLRAWTLYSAILCGARARGDSYAMRCSPYASVTRTPSKIRSAWLSLAACSPAQRVDPIEVRQILIATTAPLLRILPGACKDGTQHAARLPS